MEAGFSIVGGILDCRPCRSSVIFSVWFVEEFKNEFSAAVCELIGHPYAYVLTLHHDLLFPSCFQDAGDFRLDEQVHFLAVERRRLRTKTRTKARTPVRQLQCCRQCVQIKKQILVMLFCCRQLAVKPC